MPAHTPLPLDATLRTVVPTLDDAVNFVAKAYAVINRHEREHGPVVLCLGTSASSRGKRPNYRINDAVTQKLVAVIDGNTHQPWLGNTIELGNGWSTAFMTHAEVKQLLIEIREQERLQPRRQQDPTTPELRQ